MSLRLEIAGTTANLLIDRAKRRNAFDLAMWQALPVLLEQVAADPAVRLLVIRSAHGGAFCAGADLTELLANKDDGGWRLANQLVMNAAQSALARFALPTLAFVEGDCFGGGCGLALACDLRIATGSARFAITPAKLGLVYPLHDLKQLVDLVGPGQAKRLLFTGALIDSAEALRIGLIEAIADDIDGLAAPILSASPHSTVVVKGFVRRVLDGQTDDDDATLALFANAFTGPDFIEGTTAFIDKRKPEFRR